MFSRVILILLLLTILVRFLGVYYDVELLSFYLAIVSCLSIFVNYSIVLFVYLRGINPVSFDIIDKYSDYFSYLINRSDQSRAGYLCGRDVDGDFEMEKLSKARINRNKIEKLEIDANYDDLKKILSNGNWFDIEIKHNGDEEEILICHVRLEFVKRYLSVMNRVMNRLYNWSEFLNE